MATIGSDLIQTHLLFSFVGIEMEEVSMCDQSNGFPTWIFFENLYTINIMDAKADDRLEFWEGKHHHALKKGAAPWCDTMALPCSSILV